MAVRGTGYRQPSMGKVKAPKKPKVQAPSANSSAFGKDAPPAFLKNVQTKVSGPRTRSAQPIAPQ